MILLLVQIMKADAVTSFTWLLNNIANFDLRLKSLIISAATATSTKKSELHNFAGRKKLLTTSLLFYYLIIKQSNQ